ncbi:putative abieta-7,13-dien-18-ol hydroxylase [Rosa chinensis]|uniref:Putative abieta-7,13-dien-18-ol hydroxylase n=1 Tax=Rosa chinensis TaxID=74649 RepID=A0A2P6SIJ7_ROSCH|nr:cytochrome P450 704C1 [Rosa chinensis]PRQ58490.1 putative abieta-7,13-dien-18-ol hydroxylase [Rosa chinensis]
MDFASAAVALSLALVLAVVVVRHHARRLRDKNKRYHPIAGTVVHQLINFPRLHHYMTELAGKYYTYRMLDLFKGAVYTADPANVEYVLKTNFANYGKGSYMHNIFQDGLGDGIFSVDGQKWVHQKKLLSAEFSTKVLRDFSSAVFKTNAIKLAGIIHAAATSRNQAIEIQDLFMKSTLDSIIKILLGIELDSMSGKDEEGNRFSHAFESGQEATLYRLIDMFWKIKRFLNIGKEAELKKNIKEVDQFLYKLINSKIETIQNPEDDNICLKKRDFVSRRLEMKDTDPKYLRDMVLCVTVAGQDTTASSLSWFVYMMCKHLHIQEKIAQEVREVINLKDKPSVDELAASLDQEALNNMQYLHAALSETIRLYPAIPMNARVCLSDDTWPDGFSVKKGDVVVYQHYAMGRMKSLWGDDAEEFRPERWLDKNGLFQDESPYKFTSFSAGPRICLGKEYAYTQMKIISAVLLSSYIFKLAYEEKIVTYKTMISLPIDGGLYVKASPRLWHARP